MSRSREIVTRIISVLLMAGLAYAAIHLDGFLEEQASKRIAEEARELEIARQVRKRQCAAMWPLDNEKQGECIK